MKIKNLLMAATTVATLGSIGTVSAQASAASSKPVYRLYNPNTGEHFYTESAYERDSVKSVGWNDEGIGWQAATSGAPVYRVYNPNVNGGDHYYTMSKYEAQSLVNKGWRWDNNIGEVFYSGGSVNLYVAYNPNASAGSHNYTTNTYEQNNLLGRGWKYGAVAWKTMGASDINSGGTSGGNNGGNNGGTVTPPKPTLPAGMSSKAPNQNTLNQLPAKASAGVSAAEIKKITGVSSYEGVQNIAYDTGMGVITYLFGRGSIDINYDINENGTAPKEAIKDFIYGFGAGSGPLTIKMVNAVIDYAGLPVSNHVTKADYPFLPEQ